MKPDNAFMIELTAGMPCKQINIRKHWNHYYEIPEEYKCVAKFDAERSSWFFDKPYLQRYYAGTTRDNKDVWIHRFLSGDSERHLHSHPFNCVSVMLSGRYDEERINRFTKSKDIVITTPNMSEWEFELIVLAVESLNHGIKEARAKSSNILMYCRQQNIIDVFDWHRITSVAPETWTMLIVDQDRLPFWFFVNDSGEFESKPSSERDWWKNYKPRGQNVGDVCTLTN